MATNGTLSPPALPPAPASPSIAKRKLSATHALARNGASAPAHPPNPSSTAYPLQMVLEDILAVLKRYASGLSLHERFAAEQPIYSLVVLPPNRQSHPFIVTLRIMSLLGAYNANIHQL